MADPDDHDDAIGFSSPRSLEGAPRPAPSQEPRQTVVEPETASQPLQTVRERLAAQHHRPSDATTPIEPAVLRGLYVRYLLILCAVPTVGASALVGLLAVMGRDGRPEDRLVHSHFIYQKRTLTIAAVAAIVGVLGIAVPIVPIGVLILFALIVWIILRGAAGFIRLQTGRAIANPRGWWI